MELISRFRHRKERQIETESPEAKLERYLDLLMRKKNIISTVHNGDLIVLRTANDSDEAVLEEDKRDSPDVQDKDATNNTIGPVAVIDFHDGESSDIVYHLFLLARNEEGKVVWDVRETMVNWDKSSQLYEDQPQEFTKRLDTWFAGRIDSDQPPKK